MHVPKVYLLASCVFFSHLSWLVELSNTGMPNDAVSSILIQKPLSKWSYVMNISTPDLCDAHPYVKIMAPMFTNYGGKKSFGGEIVTAKCFEDNSLVKQLASEPGQGRVLVVDGGGSMRAALLGDMIAGEAVKQGWEGMVIYGCIRDIDVIKNLALGVQALGVFPRKTEKRGLGDLNVPINFGGAEIRPGQFIYADNNGIIISESPLG